MQKIYANIDKSLIEKMPIEHFRGRIIMISNTTEARKAVDYLKKFPAIGIDTETRPNFSKTDHYKVGLLQISTRDTCFLFRLNLIDLPDCLTELLSNTQQLKIGLSLRDDIRALHERRKFNFGKYIELQKKVSEIGIQDMSLQKIYANLFQKKISKSKRLTNWESHTLTPEQQRYAAIDAWACLRIYEKLESFRVGKEDYEYISPMNDNRMLNIWINEIISQIRQ